MDYHYCPRDLWLSVFPEGNKLLQDGDSLENLLSRFIGVDHSDWVIAILYKDCESPFNEMYSIVQ